MSVPASTIERPAVTRSPESAGRLRLTYLITSFPKLSETFLQREIRALRQLPVELELHSLWGGDRVFDGLAIHRFAKWRSVALLWRLPYWLFRKPAVFVELFKELIQRPMPSWKNLGETIIGMVFALSHARHFNGDRHRPDVIHAAWATMPATAARLIYRLTGIPFTMAAHAYDVYQDGGDWLLQGKLRDAARIITSTEFARVELLQRGACKNKVEVVPSSFFPTPTFNAPRFPREPIRIVSIGRLVEKKGLEEQLAIFAEMKQQKIAFEARMVGGGPLAKRLRTRIVRLSLSQHVYLAGSLPFTRVLDEFSWADVFVFTGKVAVDGDRDGLPNVVLEAMATGTPVVAFAVAGIPEFVQDGVNGVLLSTMDPEQWIRAIVRLRDDDVFYRRLCREARASIESHCDARINSRVLLDNFFAAR